MKPNKEHSMPRMPSQRKLILLATLTTGTCWIAGFGCIEAILASIGATFF